MQPGPVFPHELTAFVAERLAETDPELFEAISGSRQPDPAAGTGE